jgi:hypothetical protein
MFGICYQQGSCMTGDFPAYMQLNNSDATGPVSGPNNRIFIMYAAPLMVRVRLCSNMQRKHHPPIGTRRTHSGSGNFSSHSCGFSYLVNLRLQIPNIRASVGSETISLLARHVALIPRNDKIQRKIVLFSARA